nr:hypothetical protein [Tanacetum cinerariifolium]
METYKPLTKDENGASLDTKSTTGGCQFLGSRLISWQCKKQTVVANSTTEAEYIAASHCCGQVLWIQYQMMDYGYNFMHHFIRDSYEKKLIEMVKIHTDNNVADLFTKAFDKKQKLRMKQRKEAKVSHDELEDEDHIPAPFSDLLPSGRRVKSPMEKDSLGAQEDASKHGRMIEKIDQNAEIALDDETQGKTNDDEMFGVDDPAREEVVMDTTTGEQEEQIIEDISTTELVATAGEVVTTTVKDSAAPTTDILKKKDQMRINEEYARKLQEKEQEEARLSRAQQDEEANNFWDNIQAMIDANRLLAERLQARKREEFSEGQKARLLFELTEKRKKHFATLRAQEKRNKPPTKN